ncbi:MAG TPA: ABC transporter ATP-binding protein [Bacilli bacterium]|nr:ABC transporter ATP-binding protein [Bacilli bacterium]
MPETILEVCNLNKQYTNFALKNVSFDLKEGTIYGFIGRNGAGKTTTLKCIYNLVHSDSGDILYQGEKFQSVEVKAKNEIGLLFGGVDFYPNQKAKTIAKVTATFYDSWDQELYLKLLKFFDLDQEKKIKQLSNGMKVKFGLTLALSHGAKVLLLDEPTSGLDPVSRDEVLDCFMKICELKKTTILFSTHVISDLDKCADEIIYIKQGEIYQNSTVSKFKSDYLHIEGSADSLNGINKDNIGRLFIHQGKFSGIILKKQQNDFAQFALREPTLEELMLYIERGHENEETPF